LPYRNKGTEGEKVITSPGPTPCQHQGYALNDWGDFTGFLVSNQTGFFQLEGKRFLPFFGERKCTSKKPISKHFHLICHYKKTGKWGTSMSAFLE